MNLDLTDEEATALTKHMRQALDYNPYPFAPRLDPLKAILATLDPPAAAARNCHRANWLGASTRSRGCDELLALGAVTRASRGRGKTARMK
jgi:hypothetical protein